MTTASAAAADRDRSLVRPSGPAAEGAQTLRSALRGAARTWPGRAAVVVASEDRPASTVTYAELDELVDRLAAGLKNAGVRTGTPVAVKLPNGLEFTAAIFAIAQLGAVYSGIPVAFGARETEAILRRSRATVLITADRYRAHDNLAEARGFTRELPDLTSVVRVAAEGSPAAPGEHLLGDLLGTPAYRADDGHPADIVHVGFTSGTTSAPKGVLNTHETLSRIIRRWVEHVGVDSLGAPVVNLVASPVGHHTGFVWGVLMTAMVGGTAVHLERWSPAHAAATIAEHGVTVMFGAPTFLLDLLHEPAVPAEGLPSLRLVVVAGAPVPRHLPATAGERLGCYVCPAWGMTEYAIGVSCSPRLPTAAQQTDGVPVHGCQVRVVRPDGQPAAPDEPGELQIRGDGLFLGYKDQPDETAASIEHGWFRTGDNARLSAEGYVTVTGRSKDIVIRGGENIPVADIETLLHQHPAVLDCAVVGIPDTRLGERVLAVIVQSDGPPLTVPDVSDYLQRQGLSKHYLPERVELVDALPKTPSGKIRKVELRDHYKGQT